MKVSQKILILLLQCFQFLFENADAVSCKETSYKLSISRYIYFASPNYPRPFESQTQCNWLLIAPVGYRVKLQFVKFYLVNSPTICINQKVQIDDLWSGSVDGPYCGNTLPPLVRSTGRMVRVKLQSDARNVNQLYKGFQIKAIATMEASSPRLRDKNGKWLKYGNAATASGGSEDGPPELPIGPTDGLNDNDAVEARNKQINFRNNMNTLEEGKKEFQPLPGSVPKPKPKPRPKIVRKMPRPRTRPPTPKIVTTTVLTSHGHGHIDNELHHGFIIAIAAGIIFAVALAFVAHDQCKKRGILCGAVKKDENRRKASESYKNVSGNPHSAHSAAQQSRQQLGGRSAPTAAAAVGDRRRPGVTSPPPPPPHRHHHPVNHHRPGPIPIASTGSVCVTSPARRHHSQQPTAAAASGKTRSTRHHHAGGDDVIRYQRRSNPVS